MKYFITGATGFIGFQLARELRGRGEEVIAVVRDPRKAVQLSTLGVHIIQGDITAKESLRAGIRKAERVFHLAAMYKIGLHTQQEKDQMDAINVTGTRNILELMQEYQISKGVYTSSLAINSDTKGEIVDETYRFDGTHLSRYDHTKWIAHHQLAVPYMQPGLPLVIVMPGVVYGPGDHSLIGDYLHRLLNGQLLLVPKKTAYNWSYIDDIVNGHLLAMEKGQPGDSYILGGPPHTLEEAIDLAAELADVKPPKLRPRPWLLKFLSRMVKPIEALLKLPAVYSSESLRVAAGVTYLGDNTKAKQALGFQPRSLHQGLQATLECDRPSLEV